MNYLIPVYMALVGRVCGTRFKYSGLFLYPVPYVLLVNNIYLAILTFAWVFAWKNTGHADGFKDYQRDNFLSPLVGLFRLNRDSVAYDALFFSIKGGLIALLPSLLTGNIYIFVASLAGYPLAYYLSFKYSGNSAIGEFGSGFISGLGFIN